MNLQFLRIILVAKIAITLSVWALPPLVIPETVLALLFGETPAPTAVYQALLLNSRLMGIAFLALVVVYLFGYRATLRGEFPVGVVSVGLVSNGGATIVLFAWAMSESPTTWPGLAVVVYFTSLAAVGAVTASLAISFWSARRSRK